jgi:hypothetical protein
MATLLELNANGDLHNFELGDEVRSPPVRLLYLRTHARNWIENELVNLKSRMNSEIEPIAQLYVIFEHFLLGHPIEIGPVLHILRHHGAGIWELKTRDLRIFGWFPHKDCFVVTDIDCATKVKEFKLYAGYRDQGVFFRNGLPLNEPKLIEGDDPHAVISNAYFTRAPGGS